MFHKEQVRTGYYTGLYRSQPEVCRSGKVQLREGLHFFQVESDLNVQVRFHNFQVRLAMTIF